MGLEEIADSDLLFWPVKEDDADEWDAGIFLYEEKEPARAIAPTIHVAVDGKGEHTPTLVRNVAKRRRFRFR